MKGFMRQRGKSWKLRVFLGHDPLTGKKRYATQTVRGGKREAQRKLAEMVTEAERGLTSRTTATVGELLETWFEFAAPDFSPKTVKETRGYIDRSLLPTLGSKSLAKLKPAELDAFYRRLLVSGGSGGRPLAPGTVRRIHGILRRALNQGVKWGWIGATRQPRRHHRACRRRTSSHQRERILLVCCAGRGRSRRTSRVAPVAEFRRRRAIIFHCAWERSQRIVWSRTVVGVILRIPGSTG